MKKILALSFLSFGLRAQAATFECGVYEYWATESAGSCDQYCMEVYGPLHKESDEYFGYGGLVLKHQNSNMSYQVNVVSGKEVEMSLSHTGPEGVLSANKKFPLSFEPVELPLEINAAFEDGELIRLKLVCYGK